MFGSLSFFKYNSLGIVNYDIILEKYVEYYNVIDLRFVLSNADGQADGLGNLQIRTFLSIKKYLWNQCPLKFISGRNEIIIRLLPEKGWNFVKIKELNWKYKLFNPKLVTRWARVNGYESDNEG